jgi:PIN domain nuclease of toxin-antitoxin system
VRILLDTHALLWWLAGSDRLSATAREEVADETNEVLVSAASAWEVATKVRLGKLPGGEFLARDFAGQIRARGFRGLDVTVEHGQRAGSLPGHHRDPFDRMLIAQTQAENLVLVSSDAVFDSYRVQRLW